MLKPTLFAASALLVAAAPSLGQTGGPYNLTWSTIDGGGANSSAGGLYSLAGTIGQPDAGTLSSGATLCGGGFWNSDGPSSCYANCDNSTAAPVLNVNDFICFNNRFAAGDSYANCDGSTVAPVLNVNDFTCFLNKYAAGCP